MIDGPRSVIIDQAENRLHGQKAVMCLLAGVDLAAQIAAAQAQAAEAKAKKM